MCVDDAFVIHTPSHSHTFLSVTANREFHFHF
jgi:regulator of nonsense transcripts 1